MLQRRKLGAIFVLHNITTVYNEMKKYQLESILSILIIMILVCILIILALSKLIFKRLNKMISTVTRVVGENTN